MGTAIVIIGWLIVAEGVLFLIVPQLLGPVIRFFNNGFWMVVLSLLRIGLAVVFLLGAAQSRISVVIAGFGMLMLIIGAAGLIMKRQMYDTLILWWQERNLATVRALGAFVMLIGAVIVYCA